VWHSWWHWSTWPMECEFAALKRTRRQQQRYDKNKTQDKIKIGRMAVSEKEKSRVACIETQ